MDYSALVCGVADVEAAESGFFADTNFIIFVPQEVQTPWIACLPFFSMTSFESFMGFCAFSLTQYPMTTSSAMYKSSFVWGRDLRHAWVALLFE